MTLDADEITRLATGICNDITALRPYRRCAGIDSFDTGYAVQDAVVARLIATGARKSVAGYKIAVNAPGLMAHFGVEEPVSARVFADQVHEGPADLDAGSFRQFAFEPEIAAVLSADAPRGLDRDGAAAVVGRFVPAFELIDLRGLALAESRLPDVVGQNVTNAGLVLGGPGGRPGGFDPDAAAWTLTRNGEVTDARTGGAPQHPLDVVAWMADHLSRRGLTLTAGMVVLCGTHTPIQTAAAGDAISFHVDGLGAVDMRLTP